MLKINNLSRGMVRINERAPVDPAKATKLRDATAHPLRSVTQTAVNLAPRDAQRDAPMRPRTALPFSSSKAPAMMHHLPAGPMHMHGEIGARFAESNQLRSSQAGATAHRSTLGELLAKERKDERAQLLHAALPNGGAVMNRLKERAARMHPTTIAEKLRARLNGTPKPMTGHRRDAFETLVRTDVMALAKTGRTEPRLAAREMHAAVMDGTVGKGLLEQDRQLLLDVLSQMATPALPTSPTSPTPPTSPTSRPPPARRWATEIDPSSIQATADGRLLSTPPPANAILQDCKPMMASYAGEEFGTIFGTKVTYLNSEERQKFKLTVGGDGKLYDADNKPFDTHAGGSVFGGGEGKALFVMDHDGNLYASNYQPVGRFHHSSFMAGQPVAGAGEIEVRDGRIVHMNRVSGHYKPSEQQIANVVDHLVQMGVPAEFKLELQV